MESLRDLLAINTPPVEEEKKEEAPEEEEGLETLLVQTQVEERGKRSVFKSFRKSKSQSRSTRMVLSSCVLLGGEEKEAPDRTDTIPESTVHEESKEESVDEQAEEKAAVADSPVNENKKEKEAMDSSTVPSQGKADEQEEDEKEEKKEEEKSQVESKEEAKNESMKSPENDKTESIVSEGYKPKKPKTTWRSYMDPNTNRLYYYNRLTRETTWSRPVDEMVRDMTGITGSTKTTSTKETSSEKEESQDQTSEAEKSVHEDDSTSKVNNTSKRKKKRMSFALRMKRKEKEEQEIVQTESKEPREQEEAERKEAQGDQEPEDQEPQDGGATTGEKSLPEESQEAKENNEMTKENMLEDMFSTDDVEVDLEGSAIAWDGEVLCKRPKATRKKKVASRRIPKKNKKMSNSMKRLSMFKSRRVEVLGHFEPVMEDREDADSAVEVVDTRG